MRLNELVNQGNEYIDDTIGYIDSVDPDIMNLIIEGSKVLSQEIADGFDGFSSLLDQATEFIKEVLDEIILLLQELIQRFESINDELLKINMLKRFLTLTLTSLDQIQLLALNLSQLLGDTVGNFDPFKGFSGGLSDAVNFMEVIFERVPSNALLDTFNSNIERLQNKLAHIRTQL